MIGPGEYCWIAPNRLLQQVSTTELRLLEIGDRTNTHKLTDDTGFFVFSGLAASPDGKFIAWRDNQWTYSMPIKDLTKPVLPRRTDNDWYPASNTHWLSDGIHYLTLMQPFDGLIAFNSARDSDTCVNTRLPKKAQVDISGRGIQILGETRDHAIVAAGNGQFPALRGSVRVHLLRLPDSVTSLNLRIPMSGSIESSDQLTLTLGGERLVWVLKRATRPTFTARALGRFSGPPAEQEYVLCTTDLKGGQLDVIVRFAVYGQNALCGFVKVAPDGRHVSVRVGNELCIYPL
jgi:hypothetical protein